MIKNVTAVFVAVLLLAYGKPLMAGGPNFRLKDLDGKRVELAQQLKQGPALVSFWATWCHPCQDELKYLDRLYRQYSDSGLAFFAVSIDGARDRGRVKAMVKGKGLNIPVLLDPEQDAQKSFGLNEVPGLFIISPQGETYYRHLGYKPGDESEIKAKVQEAIRAARKARQPQGDAAENQPAAEDSL